MKIPIPHWYDPLMDRIACAFLPPPKPIGLSIAGVPITILDLAVLGYGLAGSAVAAWWLGSMWWFLAGGVTMGLMMVFDFVDRATSRDR